MTYKEWEWELRYLLGDLPQKEIDEITGYYREIYGDKKEAGFSDSEIIVEFGTPRECALKIKEESEITGGERALAPAENRKEEIKENGSKSATGRAFRLKPWTTGRVLLTIFVLFPLTAVAFSLLSGLASAALGCAAGAVGGVLTLLWAIIQTLMGNGLVQWTAFAGMGIASTGVLIPLAIGLTYATKYSAIFYLKFLKKIYLVKKGGNGNEAD